MEPQQHKGLAHEATTGRTLGLNSVALREYPPEEWRITAQLVRLIGRAQTWQSAVEASDALGHIQRMAKSMRDEAAGDAMSDAMKQAGVSASGNLR